MHLYASSLYILLINIPAQGTFEVERAVRSRPRPPHFPSQQVSDNLHLHPYYALRIKNAHVDCRSFYQMRLDKLRNAEVAKRNRERLNNPANFPSVPTGDP